MHTQVQDTTTHTISLQIHNTDMFVPALGTITALLLKTKRDHHRVSMAKTMAAKLSDNGTGLDLLSAWAPIGPPKNGTHPALHCRTKSNQHKARWQFCSRKSHLPFTGTLRPQAVREFLILELEIQHIYLHFKLQISIFKNWFNALCERLCEGLQNAAFESVQ